MKTFEDLQAFLNKFPEVASLEARMEHGGKIRATLTFNVHFCSRLPLSDYWSEEFDSINDIAPWAHDLLLDAVMAKYKSIEKHKCEVLVALSELSDNIVLHGDLRPNFRELLSALLSQPIVVEVDKQRISDPTGRL